MREDRRDPAVGEWSNCEPWFAWCYATNSAVLTNWGVKVRGGGPWDYKGDLSRKWGTRVAVPGDPAPEMLFYDVFTNMHYGYVGRAHRIPADILHAGAEQLGGVRSQSDWWAVEMGIRLWANHGSFLSKGNVASAVKASMSRFRNDSANDFSEVQPSLRN